MKTKTLSLLIALAITGLLYGAQLSITLKVFPEDYALTVDGKNINPTKISNYLKKISLDSGKHILKFSRDGYLDKELEVDTYQKVSEIELKLEKKDSMLEQVTVFKTGPHPKSVEFTPDGKYFASALLEGKGIDLFSTTDFTKVKTIEIPEQYAKLKNFVEIVFFPERKEMWVSQMAANAIHVIDMNDYTYKLTIPTKGIWTKIIAMTHDHKLAFASNWESHDVSVIDVNQYKVINKIKVSGIPRGMVTTADDKYLYVCIFSSGEIQKIDIASMKIVKTLNFPKGAKRHILLDKTKNLLYVSDMYRGSIYVINPLDDKVLKEIPVDSKLNTIKLSPDSKYLFVSSRGPNNPETYLKKGPKFGKVFVIDTETLEIQEWIWGKNQPTGLDVSPDGKYLAFTNFLDNEIEVYRIKYKK
ncbi:MAG: 6-phosphogluconolactonase [Spirochaetes bacterium ADurb.Bin218]|jgi:YVTN family beta-propeller protein|nr:YncE family protein [Spirochaetota bacterium]OQA98251.1 MAG: 6-phosphogluconolactonase [Spirochaetes bacterium ADurb.Bin218]HOQ10952.1 YncE family protein [Spirochaetota bacterium]HOV08346.1 YncE family protein [Spirochaetota bacterium]HPX90300.1 YncE family protein [Spirochaetota bacterium]